MKDPQRPQIQRPFSEIASLLRSLRDGQITPKKVHKLRTTARRIESLIDFAKPKLSSKEKVLVKQITLARKKAGKVRDLDVQVHLLHGTTTGHKHPHQALVENHLLALRNRRRKKLTKQLKDLQTQKYIARLKELAAGVAASPARTMERIDPIQFLQNQLAQIASQYPRTTLQDPEQLHRLRIELKKIRYTAELAAELPEAAQIAASLREVQGVIGEWHDWLTLTETAGSVLQEFPTSPLLTKLRTSTAGAFGAAIQSANQFMASLSGPAKKLPQAASQPHSKVQTA